ncbi:hypothetical protein [Flavobacterium sp. CAN_S2]|uniref:hypothetical protein n=1 Tax=Flavobacterium sp. CAN_S2 TaxID=2787726 RepID=UPI0018CBE6EB
MNTIYYIGHSSEGFNDGGQSRNKAFATYFIQKGAVIVPVYSTNHFVRFGFLLAVLKIMLFSKNNTFFIHQGTLLVLFPLPLLGFNLIRKVVFGILQHTSKRNDVTIEVNDLPYEQAKDLELPVSEISKVFQDKLYALQNVKYVFASHEMGKYINETFPLQYEVIINGSNAVHTNFDSEELPACFSSAETKFIYAGGLNKGRQIEALLSHFNNRKEILILIGEWGEWLSDYKLPDNVFYLGKFKEDYAHYLTAKCDVGIIPYEASRFYYNVCYPTKASFYIAAGIPFLSTPLLELKNIFEKTGMVYFVPFADWGRFIDDFDSTGLQDIKEKIAVEKHNFYWDALLSQY